MVYVCRISVSITVSYRVKRLESVKSDKGIVNDIHVHFKFYFLRSEILDGFQPSMRTEKRSYLLEAAQRKSTNNSLI